MMEIEKEESLQYENFKKMYVRCASQQSLAFKLARKCGETKKIVDKLLTDLEKEEKSTEEGLKDLEKLEMIDISEEIALRSRKPVPLEPPRY